MKVIINNILIELDEVQAIGPLVNDRYFDIWLLNKEKSISILVLENEPKIQIKDFHNYDEYSNAVSIKDIRCQEAYNKLLDIWKGKQEKFLTIF